MSAFVTAGGGFLLAVLWFDLMFDVQVFGHSEVELLAVGPIALVAARTVPSAVRLGARSDEIAVQRSLARAICREHMLCLASITALLALQLSCA